MKLKTVEVEAFLITFKFVFVMGSIGSWAIPWDLSILALMF